MSFPPISSANFGTSTRPYFIRALYEWCTDNGYTPHIAVFVDSATSVPNDYVKDNEIVLNIGFEATSDLMLGNEILEFKARFGGVSREIRVPITHVIAIYARENGQGMAFSAPLDHRIDGVASENQDVSNLDSNYKSNRSPLTDVNQSDIKKSQRGDTEEPDNPTPPHSPVGGWPSLKRVK
jgi:stringent starvation protein B